MKKTAVLLLFLALPGWLPAALANPCDGREALPARVVSIDDRAEILIDTGQRLALAGVEASDVTLPSLLPPLRGGLPPGAQLLYQAEPQPDRWGRQAAQVFLPPAAGAAPDWVQEIVVGKGFSRLIDAVLPQDCRARLVEAEDGAREAGLGLWGVPETAVVPAAARSRLLTLAGRRTVVEGAPISVGEGRSLIFLNFGRNRYDDFTVVISKRQLKRFEAAGMKPAGLVGRRLLVRGVVEGGRQPRIEAYEPGDIERLDRRDAASAGLQ